jgi:hypothetical protein
MIYYGISINHHKDVDAEGAKRLYNAFMKQEGQLKHTSGADFASVHIDGEVEKAVIYRDVNSEDRYIGVLVGKDNCLFSTILVFDKNVMKEAGIDS